MRFFNDALNRPSPSNKKLIPSLPPDIVVKRKPVKFASVWLRHNSGRLLLIGKTLTELFKYERVTLLHHRAVEVQGYAERLICEAIRNGDRHIPTMELADFYLHEKQLVHKLFKVIVPRYINYNESFTKLWTLSETLDRDAVIAGRRRFTDRGCLELKGNPLPSIEPPKYTSRKSYLTNVLLDAAKKDFYESKQFEKPESSTR